LAEPVQVAVGGKAQNTARREDEFDGSAGRRGDEADRDQSGRVSGGHGGIVLQAAPPKVEGSDRKALAVTEGRNRQAA